jgi:hypothetical protein
MCAVLNSKHETRSDPAVGPIFSLPTSNRAGGTRGATHGHHLSTVLVIRSSHPFATWVADHEATVLGLCSDTTVPITICNTYSCPKFQRHFHRAVQDTHSRTDTKCLLALAGSNGTATAWPCPYRAFIFIRIAVFTLQHFSRLRRNGHWPHFMWWRIHSFRFTIQDTTQNCISNCLTWWTGCAIRSPSIPLLSWPSSVPPDKRLRPRLHWSQNRHNTAVWTDSRQGSRYQPHYCLCQRLHWNWSDWNVIFQQRPTVWRQQSGFVSSRQSGQIPAAVCIGFKCCCNGQNVAKITC